VANVSFGSDSVIRRCRLQGLLCPKADTAGRFMSTRPNLIWAVVKDDNDGDPKARGNSRGGLVEEFYFSRSERPMTPENADAHERAIRDQFSRQAVGFAAAPFFLRMVTSAFESQRALALLGPTGLRLRSYAATAPLIGTGWRFARAIRPPGGPPMRQSRGRHPKGLYSENSPAASAAPIMR
jgi:hypothetical protein